MKRISGFFLAASAVIIFSGPCRAGGRAVPALNGPTKPAAGINTAGLKASTTEQAGTPCLESRDFDALSTVNDPLYRESSKEFLKQVSRTDNARQEVKASPPALRDVPNSGGAVPAALAPARGAAHPEIKMPRRRAPGPADPLKVKNTL